MERIINGLRYNTETARSVISWNNGETYGSCYRCDYTLYLTPRGRWFLHLRGGAFTSAGQNVSGGRCSGEKIEPINDYQAYEYIEAQSDCPRAREVLEEFFGERVSEA